MRDMALASMKANAIKTEIRVARAVGFVQNHLPVEIHGKASSSKEPSRMIFLQVLVCFS